MKLLPYYQEQEGAKYSGAVKLSQNREYLNEKDAQLMVEYMSDGVVIDEWLSNVRDVLTNKPVIPSKTYSDGVYVWDASHIHYVKAYRARLPRDFVTHVKKQIASGIAPTWLNKLELSEQFQAILQKLAAGDESYYDGSF